MPKITAKIKLATEFFRSQRSAILATHSVDVEGYPFGSLTPYCPLPDGSAVILISGLAQHTQNIIKNHKVALTTADQLPELQAGRRLSIMADAHALGRNSLDGKSSDSISMDELEKIKKRYLRFFPESENYFSMHDFSFYRLEFVRARHIGGFGNIFWIEKNDWASEFTNWVDQEDSALEHMNQDHKDFILKWAKQMQLDQPEQAFITAIDHEGFYMRSGHQQSFVAFKEKMKDSSELRFAFKNLSLA